MCPDAKQIPLIEVWRQAIAEKAKTELSVYE